MSRKITVTKDDIDQGEPGQEDCCPIALACKRAGMKDPFVTVTTVRYLHGGKRIVRKLPEKATAFIEEFDEYGTQKCRPFSFVIR